MKKLLIIFLFCISIYGQSTYTQNDVNVCKNKFDLAVDQDLKDKPINDVIIAIGKSFLGVDYEAHTLDPDGKEHLIIHLTGLDCYTFLESDLVFARCIKTGKTTFEDYQKELENIRYRGGKLTDYTSRLHYFSDWIYDMDKRGIAKDVTKEIGGIPYTKTINFMSTHADAYKQLKNNPAFVDSIKKIEDDINSRKYYYIPQDSIAVYEKNIQSGDILGITTNIGGLDISHTGIAIRMDDGRIHLFHAPNVGMKVQIAELPLADYIKSHKAQTGIMVIRAIEPK